MWGISGVQKEAVLAVAALARDGRGGRRRARPRPGRHGAAVAGWSRPWRWRRAARIRPTRTATTTATTRFYIAWDAISRDRERFAAWMQRHVLETRRARSTCAACATRRCSRVNEPRRRSYTAEEMMAVAAARRLRDGAICFVGIGLPSRAANLARATHAPDCVLIYESGTIGAKPAAPAALDRRRRAGRDRRRGRVGARDLQLLAAGRPHRRRLPGRGADRPLRQPQQHRDRRLRAPEGAPARRRRRARDRRLLQRDDGDAAPDAARVRRASSTSAPPSGTATGPARASSWACRRRGRDGRRHRPGRARARPGDAAS